MMTIGWWDSAVSSINRYRLLRASVAVIPVMTHLLCVQLFTKCTPLGTYVKTNATHNARLTRRFGAEAAENRSPCSRLLALNIEHSFVSLLECSFPPFHNFADILPDR